MSKVWLVTYPYTVFSTREAAERHNNARNVKGVVQEVEMDPEQAHVYEVGLDLGGVVTESPITADWRAEGATLHLGGEAIWIYVRAEDKACAELIAAAYFKSTVKPALVEAARAL